MLFVLSLDCTHSVCKKTESNQHGSLALSRASKQLCQSLGTLVRLRNATKINQKFSATVPCVSKDFLVLTVVRC